ncbi:Dsf2p ASCRUDRAFT_24010, partial [Ascoidea rubescens DSM 1968]
EIGMSFINGWGVERNENKGLEFVEKSASLGYVEAMVEAGNIWSKKGSHRKKNLYRAAVWYRFADKRGAKLIGTSWIYKEKYM